MNLRDRILSGVGRMVQPRVYESMRRRAAYEATRMEGASLSSDLDRPVIVDLRTGRVTEGIETADDGTYDKFQVEIERLKDDGAPRQERIQDLHSMQRQFRNFWYIEPAYQRAIKTHKSLLTAQEMTLEFARDADQKAWDEFDQRVKYSKKRFPKMVQDTLVLGDMFPWFIWPGDGTPRPGVPAVDMRVLDPIADGGVRDIITKRGDVETVLSYGRRGFGVEALPEDRVNHWRMPGIGNEKWGRPWLESAYDAIEILRQVDLEMFVMRMTRMRMTSFIYNITEDTGDEDEASQPSTFPRPSPNSALVIPFGVDVKFPNLREILVSGDRFEEGPTISALVKISQASGVPVHILLGKWEGTTFASSFAAEGPLVREARGIAKEMEGLVEADGCKAIGRPDAECKADIPVSEYRDDNAKAQLVEALLMNGLIDKETARTMVGLDHEEIEKRMAGEAENETEPAGESENDE